MNWWLRCDVVEGEESLESTISSFQKIILCFVIELMVWRGLRDWVRWFYGGKMRWAYFCALVVVVGADLCFELVVCTQCMYFAKSWPDVVAVRYVSWLGPSLKLYEFVSMRLCFGGDVSFCLRGYVSFGMWSEWPENVWRRFRMECEEMVCGFGEWLE